MTKQRSVEVFSAGCPVCREVVRTVQRLAGSAQTVRVRDMNDPKVAGEAQRMGVRSVPAVAIDGELADCCAERGPDEDTLVAAGLR